MQGYIKLHRQILDNPILNSEPYTKGQAWIAILLLTNHKEGYVRTKNGKLIKIERGECGYSELALASTFKWSRGKVKRFLALLSDAKMIQQKITENHSIIKVLNYDTYQDGTINSTINSTINGQQTVQQTDINNNDKNDNNENNEKKLVDPDFYFSNNKQKVFEIYKKVCTNLIPLSGETKNKRILDKVNDYLIEVDYDFERFELLCQKANELRTIVDTKIDFEMMLNNHIGIMNGKYQQKQKGVSKETIEAAFKACGL